MQPTALTRFLWPLVANVLCNEVPSLLTGERAIGQLVHTMSSERTQKPRAAAASIGEKAVHSSAKGPLPTPSVARAKPNAAAQQPTTYFAPARRAQQQEIETTIQLVAQSPVTTALLRSATSMMCILNEHRQIVATNAALLDSLDMTHSDDAIGLRPGEAMRCVHEGDHPAGCGTGPFCRACEAAIAIVASQTTGRPVERDCVISVVNRKGHERDLALSVRASPFELNGEHFTVFCMTDIGVQKLYEEFEHSFLHDLSNLAMALCASTQSLSHNDSEPANEKLNDLRDLAQRLSHAISVQRLLLSKDPSRHRVNWETVNIAEILRYLQRIATVHPCAQRKRYSVEVEPIAGELVTNSCLLERVLANMLVNAFEATEAGGEVHLKVDRTESVQRFAVHNASFITPAVAARIFHRHFSTKQGSGRGQGTYAMRLLAERLLQGKLGFCTDAEQGTTFFLELPLQPQQCSPSSRRI